MMKRAIVFPPTLSSVNRLHTSIEPYWLHVFLCWLHIPPSSFPSSLSFPLSVLQWSLRCASVTHRSGRFTQLYPGTLWPRNDTESHANPCKLQAVNPALTIRQVKQHFEGQAHPLSCLWCISELHDLLLNLPLYRQLMLNSHLRTGFRPLSYSWADQQCFYPLQSHHIYT